MKKIRLHFIVIAALLLFSASISGATTSITYTAADLPDVPSLPLTHKAESPTFRPSETEFLSPKSVKMESRILPQTHFLKEGGMFMIVWKGR